MITKLVINDVIFDGKINIYESNYSKYIALLLEQNMDKFKILINDLISQVNCKYYIGTNETKFNIIDIDLYEDEFFSDTDMMLLVLHIEDDNE